ncbi:MAG: hypothetical protein MRZ96_06620 [Clostridium sp.]|nr:hypothetical protein [Clostridium sp.]MDY5896642.1 hypothetical protein [Oscillospiraceae bacterium]
MKKYFALIISVIVILTCFTACKPKLKDGVLVTDAAGKGYAAVTQEGGGAARDDAGNLVVLVTDKNGKNVKGDNGEYQTDAIALDHAVVIGNRIECPNYSIAIPSGWSDSMSYSDLILKKDNSEDQIKLMSSSGKKLSAVMQDTSKLIDAVKSKFSDCVYTNKQVTVNGGEATLISVYVPNNSSGTATYIGYIFYEHGGTVYTCMITSDSDMGARLDDVIAILDTIEYR